MRALVVASILLTATTAHAQDEHRAGAFSTVSQRYFDQEDLWNGIYVGVGAINIAAGAALATRHDAGLRAAGIPALVFGGVQLVVGAVYLGITPGLRARARSAVDEQKRMRGVEAGFKYYKLVEGTIALTGLGLALGGSAKGDDRIVGAGVGLGVSACFQLVLEHSTHDVARTYLRALDGIAIAPAVSGKGLELRLGGLLP